MKALILVVGMVFSSCVVGLAQMDEAYVKEIQKKAYKELTVEYHESGNDICIKTKANLFKKSKPKSSFRPTFCFNIHSDKSISSIHLVCDYEGADGIYMEEMHLTFHEGEVDDQIRLNADNQRSGGFNGETVSEQTKVGYSGELKGFIIVLLNTEAKFEVLLKGESDEIAYQTMPLQGKAFRQSVKQLVSFYKDLGGLDFN